MARKLDRYRYTDRMVLEPWIVEMALERLGSQRPTLQEQQRVLRVTRTPEKVRWPDWWEALPGADHDFYAGHHEVEATPEKIGSVIAAIVMYLTLIT